MFKNDHTTSVAIKPAYAADGGHGGWFSDAVPGAGTPTVVTNDCLNIIMAELLGLLTYAGITPVKTDDTQVLAAILEIAAGVGTQGQLPTPGSSLVMSAGHTTTRVTFTAGRTRDSTNGATIVLPSALSKDITNLWAAGDTLGGRDTGSLANGQTWHCYVINKADGTADAIFSQSVTGPTMPTGYTHFRRVGSILLDAAATTISPFVQKGDDFMLTPPRADYANQSNGSGVPTQRTVSVPNGLKVKAYFSFQSNGTIDNNAYYSGVFDPDDGTPVAWGSANQRAQVRRTAASTPGGTQYSYGSPEFSEYTDAAQHVLTFSNDASDVIALKTRGWVDKRAA